MRLRKMPMKVYGVFCQECAIGTSRTGGRPRGGPIAFVAMVFDLEVARKQAVDHCNAYHKASPVQDFPAYPTKGIVIREYYSVAGWLEMRYEEDGIVIREYHRLYTKKTRKGA